MSHVFISYSHEDDDFASQLELELESREIDAWTDHDLEAGDEWKSSIDDAIKQCFALLAVMSPDAKNSEYVTYEWSYALGVGVKVIPIIHRQTSLHPKLNDLQYIDFSGDFDSAFKSLLRRVKQLELNYLLDSLHDSNYRIREKAVRRLGERKVKRAVPDLIHMLDHDRSRKIVRPAAAQTLELIGSDEALEAVKKWRGKQA